MQISKRSFVYLFSAVAQAKINRETFGCMCNIVIESAIFLSLLYARSQCTSYAYFNLRFPRNLLIE